LGKKHTKNIMGHDISKAISSSGHCIGPKNDLFRSHDCINLAVSLTVVQVFRSRCKAYKWSI